MEVKNLFDPAVKQEIINRIHTLTPQSPRQWGKMNVAQMLAHLQQPIEVALGRRTIKGTFFFNLVMPLFKKTLWDEKPWKKGLPTDATYIMTGESKDFNTEKAKLLELVSQFNETGITTEKHPVFGRMTIEQWSKSAWKHIDHHLKQFGA
ncbi:MAG: DUF1569 domain-containing protein [Sphingobacteriales bacterium]|nr:DUF1569 domain-containing protein [Sphingobacteriales bacterium]